MAKTYYRSTITFTVLSDRPLHEMDVGEILWECDEGDMVLGSVDLSTEERTREQINEDLREAGSDSGFFPSEDDNGE